jgi:hypothetical protein
MWEHASYALQSLLYTPKQSPHSRTLKQRNNGPQSNVQSPIHLKRKPILLAKYKDENEFNVTQNSNFTWQSLSCAEPVDDGSQKSPRHWKVTMKTSGLAIQR